MNAPPIDRGAHRAPDNTSARVALGFTKVPRWTADTLFAKRYWRLPDDEAHHRDVTHGFANEAR